MEKNKQRAEKNKKHMDFQCENKKTRPIPTVHNNGNNDDEGCLWSSNIGRCQIYSRTKNI